MISLISTATIQGIQTITVAFRRCFSIRVTLTTEITTTLGNTGMTLVVLPQIPRLRRMMVIRINLGAKDVTDTRLTGRLDVSLAVVEALRSHSLIL